ncbi:MAG: DEAD/DEAH box helicase [Pseudomonadota bacterium]
MDFHELGLGKALLRTLEEIGHTTPTPIQAQAIPAVLEGRDVVGLAQTGTGKTAAFLLPLLQRTDDPGFRAKFRPVQILILSPTRELAAQIYEKAREYGKSLNLKSQLAVGGVSINRQINTLSRGTDILIATPGRLLDLEKRKAVKLDAVNALVLDEADHMLDIGFFPDVKRIMSKLPAQRQTLLFSATMPKAIQDLASDYLSDPVEVSVARQSAVADKIDQRVIHMSSRLKTDRLAEIISQHPGKRIVVFARTKHGSDKIVKRLETLEIDARAIHGNKSQGQRERALKAFTKGECNVLIATDIAARGIDIKDVTMVVNYELPDVPEVYVHRIGRTARAGAEGLAVAFCAPDELNKLRAIEKLIKLDIPSEGEIIEGKAPVSKKQQKRKPRNRPGANARRRSRGSEASPAPAADREERSQDASEKRRFSKQRPAKTGDGTRNKNRRPGTTESRSDRTEGASTDNRSGRSSKPNNRNDRSNRAAKPADGQRRKTTRPRKAKAPQG